MIFPWDNFENLNRKKSDVVALPSMARRSRETHRCLRNLMTSNIGRKRISSSFYFVVIWMKTLAAGWSIFSEELALWRVCGNEMMPTFGSVTFFIWRWKLHEFSHFPEIGESWRLIESSIFKSKTLSKNFNEEIVENWVSCSRESESCQKFQWQKSFLISQIIIYSICFPFVSTKSFTKTN